MNTAPRNRAAARRACAALSLMTSRMRTLVSTATTARLHAFCYCAIDIRKRFGRTLVACAADDLLEPRERKRAHRPQQDALRDALDNELGAFRPVVSVANRLRQHQLPFG